MRVEDPDWAAQMVGNASTVSLLLISTFLTRNARLQAAFCIPFDPGMPLRECIFLILKFM